MKPISVVMSVHNGDKYLRQSIDSVLCQKDAPPFDFYIGNDGSTDKSWEILCEYARNIACKIPLYVFGFEKRNLAISLNDLIFRTNTKYIMRQDADDISHPDRMRVLFETLEAHPSVSLIGSSYKTIDSEGNRIAGKQVSFLADSETISKIKTRPPHGSWMFRRQAWGDVGGYSENFKYAQDYDLMLRIADGGYVESCSTYLYSLRLHKDSVSYAHRAEQDYYAKAALMMHHVRTGLRFIKNDSEWLKKGRLFKDIVKQRIKRVLGYV